MESLESCITGNLLLLKLEVAMELKRRGFVTVDEFEKLLTEELRKVCPDTQGDLGSYLFYFLDIIDIETPDKGRLSYVVLVPEYDVIINVEPNGTAKVVIWDSRYYGPECIGSLVKDLRRKILS